VLTRFNDAVSWTTVRFVPLVRTIARSEDPLVGEA
jgi:hypothetical protein